MAPSASSYPAGSDMASERRISGLGTEWMQFRFQQGCPDKDKRFDLALQTLKTEMQTTHYESLFGWHGSPIANWHSIIREGLDFSDIANGRAFGNGVYFSQNLATSRDFATTRSDG